MSNNLPSRLRDAVVGTVDTGGRYLPARYTRAAREVEASEYVRERQERARVRRVREVGEDAIQAAQDVTATEELARLANPRGAARYELLADAATIALARAVSDAGRD